MNEGERKKVQRKVGVSPTRFEDLIKYSCSDMFSPSQQGDATSQNGYIF